MTYLVNFFWDRVLRAVFNSCRQIPLTYFNAGNQLTPNSTMDDMHRSSKSGQGVWQLIQGIQETSWSWFKTKGISWTAKYQIGKTPKKMLSFSVLSCSESRNYLRLQCDASVSYFSALIFRTFWETAQLPFFNTVVLWVKLWLVFPVTSAFPVAFLVGMYLRHALNFFEFGGKAKIIASVRFEGLGLQGITGLLLLPDLSKGFQEALPSHQCGKCAMS